MNFDDVYKSMLLKRGGSVLKSDIKNSKDSINNQFKNDPSYKLATLKKKDININDSDLDTRIVNNINDKTKKNIYVRPDTNIEVGDYIIYPNKIYLALEVEDNLISPYAEATECNHKFKWMYKGVLHEAYGIGTNQTKYTLGTDSVQAGIVESDSRYAIDFPNCIKCKTIKVGQRFIFNEGAWKVTQVEYVSSQDNIRSILLGQDNINSEIDDVLGEIAGAYENKHTYTYNVPTSFEVANGNDYQLSYSIINELGKDFDYSLVNVTTTNNTLVNIINNKGVITIKGIGIGTGSIKLSVPIGETTKDFDISFEIKAIVTDKIDYQYKFSQGTTLKQYVSTLVEFTKIVVAIPDINLLVNYTIDSNGSSLLNSNSISITRKTNTSFLIKNINVNTSKSFVITFVDNSDNKVILSQVINLTKGI